MAEKRRWVRWVVLGLVGVGAGAFALSTPQDETRFVSVRPPAKRAGVTSARAGERTGPAEAALAPSASKGAVAAADSEAGARAEAPSKDTRSAAAAGSGAAERRNLFRPLVVAKSARSLAPESMPLLPAGFEGFLPLPDGDPRLGGRQRSYWQYVGTVRLDGVNYALVEERKSKEGHYLKKGDTFRGGLLEVLQPDYLVLSIAGKRYTLPKSTGLSDTSSSSGIAARAALPMTAANVPPGQPPGAPSPYGAAPGMPGAPGAPTAGTPGTPYAGAPGATYPGAPGMVPGAPGVPPPPGTMMMPGQGVADMPDGSASDDEARRARRDLYMRWRRGGSSTDSPGYTPVER